MLIRLVLASYLALGVGLAQVELPTLQMAMKPYLGARYVWGGNSPSGIDCSGFTQAVYRRLGVQIPRTAYEQFLRLPKLGPQHRLEVGDLVFFRGTINNRPVDHVGLVIGGGWMVHSALSRGGVVMEPIQNFAGRYIGARRVFWRN